MLDKSSYILEIEKQKLEVEKLGKKFLSFDLSKSKIWALSQDFTFLPLTPMILSPALIPASAIG